MSFFITSSLDSWGGKRANTRVNTAFWCALLCVVLCTYIERVSASRQSELSCSPTTTESNTPVTCIIYVRNSQQEPTTSFSPSQFLVNVISSTPSAVVNTSPVTTGHDDPTTALFTLAATHGTNATVQVIYQAPVSGTDSGPIRRSGLTIAILSRPATFIGPLLCNVTNSAGLTLRGSTRCTAPLLDERGHPAVSHNSDVMLREANIAGAFTFVSGIGQLVFIYQAPNSVTSGVQAFTLFASPKTAPAQGSSISFPLQYPILQPKGSSSSLRCIDDVKPTICSVYAADAVGPVHFAEGEFTLSMEVQRMVQGTGATWVDNMNDFAVNMTVTARPNAGRLTWSRKKNDAVTHQRLRVHATSGEEVQGSPYFFQSGVPPTAATVKFRGCQVNVVTARNHTECVAEISPQVSGDVSYFLVTTQLKGSNVSSLRYISWDSVCQCAAIVFTYTAPDVRSRSDDFISMFVSGVEVGGAPFRMNIFPVPDHDEKDTNGHQAIIIAVGLLYFGVVLSAGFFVVIRRSLKIRRIRADREARELAVAAQEAENAWAAQQQQQRTSMQTQNGDANHNNNDDDHHSQRGADSPAVVDNKTVKRYRLHQDNE